MIKTGRQQAVRATEEENEEEVKKPLKSRLKGSDTCACQVFLVKIGATEGTVRRKGQSVVSAGPARERNRVASQEMSSGDGALWMEWVRPNR